MYLPSRRGLFVRVGAASPKVRRCVRCVVRSACDAVPIGTHIFDVLPPSTQRASRRDVCDAAPARRLFGHDDGSASGRRRLQCCPRRFTHAAWGVLVDSYRIAMYTHMWDETQQRARLFYNTMLRGTVAPRAQLSVPARMPSGRLHVWTKRPGAAQ